MTKWEHVEMYSYGGGWEPHPALVDKSDFAMSTGIGEMLSLMSEDGWELVAVTNASFYFKRPTG